MKIAAQMPRRPLGPVTFEQQLQKVSAFFRPENLRNLDIKYEGEIVLLVIDTQARYCDPAHARKRGTPGTRAIAERIARKVDEFRAIGIEVCNIYYSKTVIPEQEIDFYFHKPGACEPVLRKWTNSAFGSGDTEWTLESTGRKLLLVCGFNLNACIRDTILDARKNDYDVCLLRDLTGNDKDNEEDGPCEKKEVLTDLHAAGVVMEHSTRVLDVLKKVRRI